MRRSGYLYVTIAVAMAAPNLASAQDGSVKATFEKYNLIGTFAQDCSKPPTKENLYFVTRAVDDNHMQRDVMDGSTSRPRYVVIDKASALGPNEIKYSGYRTGTLAGVQRDKAPIESVWRVEPNRMRNLENSEAGKKMIANGKWLGNGRDTVWLSRCGAR